MKKSGICVFFGHREVSHDISAALRDAVLEMIESHDIKTFWCGNKGEFDRLAARTVFELKAEFPDIELIYIRAYMPKPGETLPDCYTDSIYPEGLETVPRRFAVSHRNKWMVKHCTAAITYITHDWGGAYQAYCALKSDEKYIINIE